MAKGANGHILYVLLDINLRVVFPKTFIIYGTEWHQHDMSSTMEMDVVNMNYYSFYSYYRFNIRQRYDLNTKA